MFFIRSILFISFIILGSSHAFGQFRYDSIKVYIFLADACRICQEMSPHIRQIQEEFRTDYEFTAVFPNLSSEVSDIEKFIKKYKLNLRFITDYDKKLTTLTGATITPEVVVWNELKQKAMYRGRINDLYSAPGKRKHHISSHDLRDVLINIREGREIESKTVPAVGCFINFADIDEP